MDTQFLSALNYFSKYNRQSGDGGGKCKMLPPEEIVVIFGLNRRNSEEKRKMEEELEEEEGSIIEEVYLSDYLSNHEKKDEVMTIFDVISKYQVTQVENIKTTRCKLSVNQQQPKHVRVFFMIFLCYLRELSIRPLKVTLGDEYTNKNIPYTVSIEKQFLATIFGDKSC